MGASTIKDSGYFSLRINDTELPTSLNLIRSATGVESLSMPPVAVFEFNDTNGVLRDKLAIVDGTKISIDVGASSSRFETQHYTAYAPRTQEVAGGRIITATCVLNKPKFLYDVRSHYSRSTSVEAIRKLCSASDVKLVTELQSNDSMTWLSVAKAPRMTVRDILQRAWIGEGKLPLGILTSKGEFILRDVTAQLDNPKAKLVYMANPETGELPVLEWRTKSISGLMNVLDNYGSEEVAVMMDGTQTERKGVKMSSRGDVNINSDVKKEIVTTRISHKPYDPGSTGAAANVHKKWHDAEYNNNKVAASFTELGRVLFRGYAGLTLLDALTLRVCSRQEDTQNFIAKDSGVWLIVGRTWKFESSRYYESYMLSRNYTPVEGNTPLSSKSKGNAPFSPVSSVANTVRPNQINSKITQDASGMSAIDKLAGEHAAQLENLTGKFKIEGLSFKTPELVEKYGEDADFLDSTLKEFSMAQLVADLCSVLSPLEKLSVSIVFDMGPRLLDSLAARLDSANGLLGKFASDINNLVAKGDIPSEYLGKPKVSQTCTSKSMQDLMDTVSDKFPSKCIDSLTLTKLNGPSLSLGQIIKKLEDQIRDLLCSWGDGTVDGSGAKSSALSELKSIKEYIP